MMVDTVKVVHETDDVSGGTAADWAEAMEYIEKKFMPLLMRSPGHGCKSPACYFPDLAIGCSMWFRVQLLLFKPHQGIYESVQPLLHKDQTAEKACAASGILCPLCMCPTIKVFQYGCDYDACQTRKLSQQFGLLTRLVLLCCLTAIAAWNAAHFSLNEFGPGKAFHGLSALLLGFAVFNSSMFLEVQVGYPLPHQNDRYNFLNRWFRKNLILDAPDERFVTPKHRLAIVTLMSMGFGVFLTLFISPFGLEMPASIAVCVLLWTMLLVQFYLSPS